MTSASTRALAVAVGLVGCVQRGPIEGADAVPPPRREPPRGVLPPEAQAGTPVDGGTLTVLMPTEPAQLTYLFESDLNLLRMTVPLVYEPLVWAEPDDPARFVPRLAERWDASPDGLVYTFTVRDGVRWHDGAPLTADDVLFTFDLVMDPKGRSAHVRSAWANLTSWTRLDARTIRFTFAKPYFLTLDAFAATPILPKHVFGGGDAFANAANRRPVGTGPFRFASWESGDKRLVLERNAAYWGERAHVERVVFRFIEDRTVSARVMARGEADVLLTYTPEQWLRAADDAAFVSKNWLVRDYAEGGFTYIGWNEQRPLFADRRVRAALARLVDRDYVERRLLKGLYADHACALYFAGPDCDPSHKPPPYDPAGARRLLDEAGWSDHDGDGLRDKDGVPLRFTFTYPNGSTLAEQVGILLRDELARSGIEVRLQRLEWATFLGRLRRGELEATSLAWGGGVRVDPTSQWHSGPEGGRNWLGFSNPEADSLLDAARGELDDERRHALFREFGRVLSREAPDVWLGTGPTLGAINKRVRGARVGPGWDYARLWLEPEARP